MGTQIKKKIGKDIKRLIDKYYTDYKFNYEKFVDRIQGLKEILEDKGVTLDEVFKLYIDPITDKSDIVYVDENGNEIEDTLIDSENNTRLIDTVTNHGWINKKVAQQILKDKAFLLFKKNTKIQDIVLNDITENSLHILGLCNNPINWGENKQGVTMGMVQSGKTVSMLCLTSMAIASGYKLIIFLTGNKESLRNQTQVRIDDTFGLSFGPVNYTKKARITSSTTNFPFSRLDNYINTFLPKGEDIVIITILKETQNLKKLNKDLNLCKEFCKKHKIDFASRYPTLILDDESDSASLDISPNSIKGIHEQLVKLRSTIKYNCFIGYTATPQGCLASEPNSPVGYPKDFLWLLEPMMSPSNQTNTLSYMGLHEFFIQYRTDLVRILPPNVWPHYHKRIDGKNEGIYNPLTQKKELLKIQHLEEVCAQKYLNDNSTIPESFYESIIGFIITSGIDWFRYRNLKKPGTIPKLDEIDLDYPYQAMMFNLTLSKDNHKLTKKLIQQCVILVEKDFILWNLNKKSRFDVLWLKQIEKTNNLLGNIDYNRDGSEIKPFCQLALDLIKRPLKLTTDFVYILNGDKESDVLNYNQYSGKEQTKKCAIFIGGNILSRGLTIEGLTSSFFVRSQAATIMDTSLQMCRWFGHKKSQIDLLTLYLMDPMLNLFIDVAKCDDGLRKSMKAAILKNQNPQKILIELWSTKLFSLTSKQKSKLLQKNKKSAIAYTGNTSQLLEPFVNGDIKIIESNIKQFDNFLKSIKKHELTGHLNRGSLFKNVDFKLVIGLLKSLEFSRDALYVTPKEYAQYLEDWQEEYSSKRILNPVPPINIGFINDKKRLFQRQRDFKIEPKNHKEAIENQRYLITPFLGGRGTNYKGDKYYDKDAKWHKSNIAPGKNRILGEEILLLFYKIDPNYLNKKYQLRAKDKGFLNTKNGVLTFAVVTPIGGPYYEVHTNKLINI
jgi:hypothetical protein